MLARVLAAANGARTSAGRRAGAGPIRDMQRARTKDHLGVFIYLLCYLDVVFLSAEVARVVARPLQLARQDGPPIVAGQGHRYARVRTRFGPKLMSLSRATLRWLIERRANNCRRRTGAQARAGRPASSEPCGLCRLGLAC